MTAWTPLAPVAEHPRTLPRLGAGPQLLIAPAPRVGLAWFARQAAALRFELPDSTHGGRFNELRARGAGEGGEYRRPLDSPESRTWQAAGIGWRSLGTRGAGIGRVVIDQETQPTSSPSPRVMPYTSSPFVVADTLSPEMRRARARLEGMGGWTILGMGLGLGVGLETRELRSIDAPLRRSTRATRQGVTSGLARRFPWAALTLGAHARWQGGTENGAILPRPGRGIAFAFQGYAEPDSLVIDLNALTRRIESRASAAGGGASARVLGTGLVAYGEATQRSERHVAGQLAASPRERWDADGLEWGIAAQRSLWGARMLLTGWVRGSEIHGDAYRPDLAGIIVTARESRLAMLADARFHAATSPWHLGVQVGTERDELTRLDYVAEVEPQVDTWTPTATFETAREVGTRGALALAIGVGQQAGSSSIPLASERGPVYKQYLGPELAVEADAATMVGATLTARWRLRAATWWASLGGETLRPGAARSSASPGGQRTSWSVAIGVQP